MTASIAARSMVENAVANSCDTETHRSPHTRITV
jgi:hypothetical protein